MMMIDGGNMDKKYYFIKTQIQDIEDDLKKILFDAGGFEMLMNEYVREKAFKGYDKEKMKEYFDAVVGSFLEEELMKYTDY